MFMFYRRIKRQQYLLPKDSYLGKHIGSVVKSFSHQMKCLVFELNYKEQDTGVDQHKSLVFYPALNIVAGTEILKLKNDYE